MKKKDKSYIAKNLALPAEARNMKVKTRLPVPSIATSGRWSKRADGEWGFDLDDPPKAGENEEANAAALAAAAASGKLNAEMDSDSDNDENMTVSPDNVKLKDHSKNLTNLANLQTQQNLSSNNQPSTEATSSKTSDANRKDSLDSNNQIPPSIHLVLRMRDEKKELQDIKFDFLPNKDTVDEISHELVNAKLIDAIDMVAVSANLNKLLENRLLSPITFSLVIYTL